MKLADNSNKKSATWKKKKKNSKPRMKERHKQTKQPKQQAKKKIKQTRQQILPPWTKKFFQRQNIFWYFPFAGGGKEGCA